MITGTQIRAARAALRWTAEDLAARSGIAARTIKRLEQDAGVPASRSTTLIDLKKALESGGIEFVGSPDDAPGIRLRTLTRQNV